MPFPILLAAATVALALPQGAALTQAIAARDAEFFGLFFTGCDPARIAPMLTPDFEMYHDKGGVVARTSAAFVADYAKACEARKAPDAWRSRRELLRETLHVYPLPNYGAIEEGEHVFWERRGDGPEKRVGWARFVQVWAIEGGSWKLARVLSYDHRPIEAAPVR